MIDMEEKTNISETYFVLHYSDNVFENLLKDHTTQQNIYWATDSYLNLGEGYKFEDPITTERISYSKDGTLRPRSVKSKEEITKRVKDKAEVFTPSWICNVQNNLIDEAWFGRKNVFNTEIEDEHGNHSWIANPDKIEFPSDENQCWKNYVAEARLEVTCGEAPYLVSRYDSVSGERIEVENRIGLIDRKLRVVSENTETTSQWLAWAKIALASSYGFEWQGDNLLLARENVFCTFIDFYEKKFKEDFPKQQEQDLLEVAHIISWNLWQMDGLTFGLPGHKVKEENATAGGFAGILFGNNPPSDVKTHERLCRLNEFFDVEKILELDVEGINFLEVKNEKQFISLLPNKR